VVSISTYAGKEMFFVEELVACFCMNRVGPAVVSYSKQSIKALDLFR
jgi:hypothetical protein